MITNQDLFSTDWAAADRQAFIRSVSKARRQKDRDITPGLATRGVWMNDVSAMDRRSIKAQLAGQGYCRTLWWELNLAVHRLLQPQASLEQVMFAFHKRHHFLTIASLSLVRDYHDVFQAIRAHGVLSGVQCAIRLHRHPQGE